MIKLRALVPNDLRYFELWWRAPELIQLTSGDFTPLSDEQIRQYFELMLSNPNDIQRMIVNDKKTIGHITLSKREDSWWETQIVIGDALSYGKGYGTEAIRQIINLASDVGAINIYLQVRPENTRAIRSYYKVGFRDVDESIVTGNPHQPILLRMEYHQPS